MSYPSPYGGQYPDIYGTESPSTPHPQQPPGAFPQWETVEHTQIHDLHSLQSSHHSTPMQTPTSTSFRPIELEEPPRFVPSQAHLSHSPMEGSAPVLLHHPHAVQQQQFQQHQYDYLSQHQQQMHQQTGYEQMQEMGPPDSSALFRTPQQPMGVLRSIPSSRGRAVASHPYDRRASGGSLSSQRGYDSPGESVESRATPVAVSPVPSSSGSGVTITPVPYVAPAPALPSPTRATTRRTRSSTKPKASVRFEAGTKATSGPAPTSRAAAARAGTPVPSTSTNTGSTSTVPLLRSATRKATFSARTPPPSQTIATSIAAASGSGSGSRTTPSNARSVPQPSSSLSTSALSTSAPSTSTHDPSTIPHAPPSMALETRIRSSSYPRGLITAIATDMQYSPENHTLTASLELPGIKRENLQVKLETCYYNRVKYLVVLALSIPVFDTDRSEKAAGDQHSVVSDGRGHPSTIAPGTLNVHMRREEEEEEEDGDSSMKTEVPETTAPVPPPTRMATRHRSPSATPTAPSPLITPPSTSIPPTSASEQNLSLSPYGMVKPPPPSSSDTAGSTIRITREAMRKLLDPTLRERRFGIKRRIIQVPSTTTLANIKASLEDGVLTLQIDCGPPYEIDDQIDIPVR